MQLLFRTKTEMPQIGLNYITQVLQASIYPIGNFLISLMASMPGNFPIRPYPPKVFFAYFAAAKIVWRAHHLSQLQIRLTSIRQQVGIPIRLVRILYGMALPIFLSMSVHTIIQVIPKIQFFTKTKPLLYLVLPVLLTARQPHVPIIQVKPITKDPTSS